MKSYGLARREERVIQLGPDEHGLLIRNGRVFCPRRGVVDLTTCWACPAYRGLTAGPVEHLACSADEMAGESSAVPTTW